MKIFILISLILLVTAATKVHANLKNPVKDLTITADPIPPYSMKTKSKDQGFFIDLVTEIYKDNGIEIKYAPASWAQAVAGLMMKDRYHLIANVSESDIPNALYSKKEIVSTNDTFWVLKNNSWKFKNIKSLQGLKLGIIIGHTYSEQIEEYVDNNPSSIIKVSATDGRAKLIEFLKQKKIDAVIEDYAVMKYSLKQSKNDKEISAAGGLLNTNKLYIAFSPRNNNSKELLEIFEKGLEKVKKDGRFKALILKYEIK